MNISFGKIKNITQILRPRVPVGGIYVTDAQIGYVHTNTDASSVLSYSLPLPQGIVVRGIVQDASQFVAILRTLHEQIAHTSSKQLPVVISVSDANIYTQTFSLPSLRGTKMKEAVALNMEMVSPLEKEDSYTDWQEITASDGGQKEILASFVEKKVTQPIVQAAEQAGFGVVAVEQGAMSLARLLAQKETGYKAGQPYFLLSINTDGLSFSVMMNGVIRFNRFASWGDVMISQEGAREISSQEFRNLLVRETHQVMNYYSSHFPGTLEQMYLIAPGMEKQVQEILGHDFSFSITTPQLRAIQLTSEWFVALGAALRGNISRGSDTAISLAPQGTEEKFLQSQILYFIELWRNIVITVGVVVLVALLSTLLFLQQHFANLKEDAAALSGSQNVAALETLRIQAEEFNEDIALGLKARDQQSRWAQFLSGVYAQTQGVTIERLYIQSAQQPITINARASGEAAALSFKNRLETIEGVTKVDLPLSSVTPAQGGSVSFRVIITVSDLKF
jgi:Tfp pilus assembly PilM family ATPase